MQIAAVRVSNRIRFADHPPRSAIACCKIPYLIGHRPLVEDLRFRVELLGLIEAGHRPLVVACQLV